jgi:hypothetical protein
VRAVQLAAQAARARGNCSLRRLFDQEFDGNAHELFSGAVGSRRKRRARRKGRRRPSRNPVKNSDASLGCVGVAPSPAAPLPGGGGEHRCRATASAELCATSRSRVLLGLAPGRCGGSRQLARTARCEE